MPLTVFVQGLREIRIDITPRDLTLPFENLHQQIKKHCGADGFYAPYSYKIDAFVAQRMQSQVIGPERFQESCAALGITVDSVISVEDSLDSQLLSAVTSNNTKAVSELLSLGANPNTKDYDTQTPLLMLAAKLCYLPAAQDIFEILLNHPKCDQNIKDSHGNTVLMYFMTQDPFVSWHQLMVDKVLGTAIDTNVLDNSGNHALLLLLQTHAKIVSQWHNAVTKKILTPEAQAGFEKRVILTESLLDALLKSGARINIHNNEGQNPLQIAKSCYRSEAIYNLLQKYTKTESKQLATSMTRSGLISSAPMPPVKSDNSWKCCTIL